MSLLLERKKTVRAPGAALAGMFTSNAIPEVPFVDLIVRGLLTVMSPGPESVAVKSPVIPGPKRMMPCVLPRGTATPVLLAKPAAVVPRFNALIAGLLTGEATVMSTPEAVAPAETVMTFGAPRFCGPGLDGGGGLLGGGFVGVLFEVELEPPPPQATVNIVSTTMNVSSKRGTLTSAKEKMLPVLAVLQ